MLITFIWYIKIYMYICSIQKQNNMKTLTSSFRALINNSATSKDKVIVWAMIAAPLLVVLIAFGQNLK